MEPATIAANRPKREKRAAKRILFTDLAVKRLKLPKNGQVRWWDDPKEGRGDKRGQAGLSILLSAGGARTYQATFSLNGKTVTDKLGRVSEMTLTEARKRTAQYRRNAGDGIDPRRHNSAEPQLAGGGKTFQEVVDLFIELYAKPKQRSWDSTKRILLKNCAGWLGKEFAAITKADAYKLLDAIVAQGHGPKAEVTRAWLQKMWRWAFKRDLVATPMIDAVQINYEKKYRDRVFTDAEIKAIWKASDQLDANEGGFIKLLMLLAPRKTALACLRRSHLDNLDQPTLWTTPFELTKSRKTNNPKKRRVYLTPLPPLAQRILKGVIKHNGDDRIFPMKLYQTEAGQQVLDSHRLTDKLVKHGAPRDFGYHVVRHTVATWLEDKGHSEWERGLVLNHSGSGVTAGYSHGHATKLKLEILTEWADHIEQVVQAEGVALGNKMSRIA